MSGRNQYISKTRTYRPLVPRSDSELAICFDEWAQRQPEDVRVAALCHVENVKGTVIGIGDVGAKALVFRTYAEVLDVEIRKNVTTQSAPNELS